MKKFLASVLACAMVASMAVQVFAADKVVTGWLDDQDDKDNSVVYENIKGYGSGNSIAFEDVRPDQTYWIKINDIFGCSGDYHFYNKDGDSVLALDNTNDLGDKDLFKVSYDKSGDGKSLIKSIELITDKRQEDFDESERTAWFKVTTNQTFNDSEKKAKIEITFKPKKADPDKYNSDTFDFKEIAKPSSIDTSAEMKFNLTFWVKNQEIKGDDADVEAGDGFVFDPANNEKNTIVYGDDRAAIYFDANDDADKFYAKLSTSAHWDIIENYGDPVDADLWFYDFVGNKTIPSTSRATLTLGIPWDEDKDDAPNPEDVYIYRIDEDGSLTDVTDTFVYNEDNDNTTGIAGWTQKTRTLGTYVVADRELDLDDLEEDDSSEDEAPASSSSDSDKKDIPNTGASDMVNVAVVAAIVSLAAAGAVAFKKSSK